jgi:DNA polymerase phi
MGSSLSRRNLKKARSLLYVYSFHSPSKVWLSQLGTQIHSVPSPPYSDNLQRQCRERLLCCLADLTQLSVVAKTVEKAQRFTGIALNGQLWLSRVVEIIRKLEQDSKHVTLLSELSEDDRGKLEQAHRAVARLRKVRPRFVLLVFFSEIFECQVSGDQREQAEGVQLLLQSFIIQFYIEDSSEGRDTASLEVRCLFRPLKAISDVSMAQSCIDCASRLFHPWTEKFNVLESPRDDELQQPPPEPIDVLVDTIIGCLEKGTAFMRAVGIRSFSLLSGVVKDTTINLILSVSVFTTGLPNIPNIIHSNWNVGTLGNFLLTPTKKATKVTMGIWKAVEIATSCPPLGLRAAKVMRHRVRNSRASQKFSRQKGLSPWMKRLMKSLRGNSMMIR